MWRRLPNANAKNNRSDRPGTGLLAHLKPMQAFVLLALATAATWAFSTPGLSQTKPLAANQAGSIQTEQVASGNAPNQPAENQADESQSDVALAILYRCLHESVFAKQPAESDVRQTIRVYGKNSVGVGHYVRGGKRLGQLRYSLQFSSREQLNSLLQVCDGQRLLTLEEVHGQRRYSEVDISQIRGRLAQNGLNDRTLYDKVYLLHLSIGGQSEVLRTLCQKYTWHSVSEAVADGQPAWRLLGTLATEPQPVHGFAPVDEQLFGASQSGLIPTKVEAIVATNDADFPFWLHRVAYTREPATPENADDGMQAATEWHNPKILTGGVDPQIFQTPGAGGHAFVDDTHRYMPPLNLAAKPTPELNR